MQSSPQWMLSWHLTEHSKIYFQKKEVLEKGESRRGPFPSRSLINRGLSHLKEELRTLGKGGVYKQTFNKQC